MKYIECRAFENCTALAKLNYNGSDAQYPGIVIREGNESLIALKSQDEEIQKNTVYVPYTLQEEFIDFPRGLTGADYIESLVRKPYYSIPYEELLKVVAEKGLIDAAIGDINKDGKIEAMDARIALHASVGLENVDFNIIYLGDIDNYKVIAAADARLILRASVNLEDSSLWV